ncbi:MAG: hypothetical protein LBP76_10705, partial [Treponema sp.]|nr:hypothetical protein [Treponema sp.]
RCQRRIGSGIPSADSSQTGFRLQYGVGLFDLGMREMRLTEAKTGEKLSNFQGLTKGDLIIADRA